MPLHISATTNTITTDIQQLGPYDIICGRCSTAFNNIGNRRFRVLISINLPRYLSAISRNEKSAVINSIVQMMLNDIGCRFFKKRGTRYIELEEVHIRQKVGHALRDLAVNGGYQIEDMKVVSSLRKCPRLPRQVSAESSIVSEDSKVVSSLKRCSRLPRQVSEESSIVSDCSMESSDDLPIISLFNKEEIYDEEILLNNAEALLAICSHEDDFSSEPLSPHHCPIIDDEDSIEPLPIDYYYR